jgi:benzoate membrane transport protein
MPVVTPAIHRRAGSLPASGPAARTAAIAVPLYLVTMTSQNIPGVAVMKSLGYDVPWRPALGYTGAATALGAGLGGHAINLSAIAAALAAGPEAGKDPARRWIAGVTTGIAYLAFGLTSRLIVTVAQHAPAGLFAAVAAVGLLGSFAAAAVAALESVPTRVAAAVTLVVASSGLEIAGIGSAFWALVAGCVLTVVLTTGRRPTRA